MEFGSTILFIWGLWHVFLVPFDLVWNHKNPDNLRHNYHGWKAGGLFIGSFFLSAIAQGVI